MQLKNNLFYIFYNAYDIRQQIVSSTFTNYSDCGIVPQTNKAYEIKAKFDIFKCLQDKTAFQKAQQHYWLLCRFFKKLSLKNKVKHSVEEDLYGSPLVPRFTIELLQDGCVYKFSIHDLIRIIKTSLSAVTNNWYYDPKMPCNPYTNKEFEKHHLYSIYVFTFTYCPRLLINSELLLKFQKSDFNLTVFIKQNQRILTELFIDTLVSKDTTITIDIISDILLMIKMYCNPFTPIEIQSTISKNILFNVFRPYLRLFYKITFLKCDISLARLKRGLRNFALFNPLFGHTYYDFATKKIEVDVRCLSCGDFSEDNGLFDEFAKIRGSSNTLCLPPIKDVYYFPPKIHVLKKTLLERVPNMTPIQLFNDDDDDADDEDDADSDETCE